MITREDRNLLVRVGKQLKDAAQLEFNGYGANWGVDAASREAKRRHDRLLRDERDLQALRRRLEADVPPSTLHMGPLAEMKP